MNLDLDDAGGNKANPEDGADHSPGPSTGRGSKNNAGSSADGVDHSPAPSTGRGSKNNAGSPKSNAGSDIQTSQPQRFRIYTTDDNSSFNSDYYQSSGEETPGGQPGGEQVPKESASRSTWRGESPSALDPLYEEPAPKESAGSRGSESQRALGARRSHVLGPDVAGGSRLQPTQPPQAA